MRVLGLVWSRIAQHSKEREKAKKRTEQKERQEAGNERQSGRRLYYRYLDGLPKEPLSPRYVYSGDGDPFRGRASIGGTYFLL